MKKALLIVHFGTSVPQAQGSLLAVERVLALAAPGWDCYTALTSPTIRKILRSRGQEAKSLEEALEALAGYDTLAIQPTHLLGGIEYDKIRETVAEYAGRFPRLLLGGPLLRDTGDLREMAACLARLPARQGEALVLMGHGTDHAANLVYPALQTALRLAGREDAYVGTVEGWPTLEDVIGELNAAGETATVLRPLMLVAGNHALEDMAGDSQNSWKSRLEAGGFRVRCHMEGLGTLPQVQAMYRRHLEELLARAKGEAL